MISVMGMRELYFFAHCSLASGDISDGGEDKRRDWVEMHAACGCSQQLPYNDNGIHLTICVDESEDFGGKLHDRAQYD